MQQRSLLTQFSADVRGATLPLYGLMAVPMFVVLGLAIDTGRMYTLETEMKSALDAASMAAATVTTSSEQTRINTAVKTYQTNMNPGSPDSVPAPSVTIGVGFVTVSASTPFNYSATRVLQLITGNEVTPATISGSSSVTTAGKTLEVAMMLDVTGSMEELSQSGTTKISDLKFAAKDLIDIVMPTGGEGSPTKVSIVPFSSKVNVGSIAPNVTGYNATWYGYPLVQCVTERQGTNRFTDVAPGSGSFVGPTNPGYSNNYNYGYTPDCKVSHHNGGTVTLPEVKPLSTDKTMLKNHIDAMATGSGTAGHLGTAWAWYTLSPNWNSVWSGTDNDARSYSISRPGTTQTNIKSAIIMTDGEYNADYSSNYSSAGMAAELCTRMKAEGIIVYTIGFGIDNEDARNVLRNCASSDPADPAKQFYFFPYDRNALRDAFRSIGQALSYAQGTARLSQ